MTFQVFTLSTERNNRLSSGLDQTCTTPWGNPRPWFCSEWYVGRLVLFEPWSGPWLQRAPELLRVLIVPLHHRASACPQPPLLDPGLRVNHYIITNSHLPSSGPVDPLLGGGGTTETFSTLVRHKSVYFISNSANDQKTTEDAQTLQNTNFPDYFCRFFIRQAAQRNNQTHKANIGWLTACFKAETWEKHSNSYQQIPKKKQRRRRDFSVRFIFLYVHSFRRHSLIL